MIRRLRRIGFTITVEPTGAFYVFVNARHLSGDSYALAFDILEKAHVGVSPGIDFGPNGEGYLRFSYANSLENIKEGLDRLERYVQPTPADVTALITHNDIHQGPRGRLWCAAACPQNSAPNRGAVLHTFMKATCFDRQQTARHPALPSSLRPDEGNSRFPAR
jgi:hypothetical protein